MILLAHALTGAAIALTCLTAWKARQIVKKAREGD